MFHVVFIKMSLLFTKMPLYRYVYIIHSSTIAFFVEYEENDSFFVMIFKLPKLVFKSAS